jgi:DNA repair photolyase
MEISGSRSSDRRTERALAPRRRLSRAERTFYTRPMSEKLFELRRRTFDTPHFRGIEFIEVEAKSIINKVPGNYLPFNWTINPYRGCSHACSYCISGDTPILMADGRTMPIAELNVGDHVIGTEVVGSIRRYVETRVLAHWSTHKSAFRTSLVDGRELVSSGDHRWLSEPGWRFVVSRDRSLALRQALHLMGIPEAQSLAVGDHVQTSDELLISDIKHLDIEMPMYDITTGTGDFIANGVVSHNCFARVTHTYLDMDAGRDFETKIVVKVNAPELLRSQLRRKSWTGETIAMGTGTDPYQRAEGRYKLMPRIIEALTEVRNPFSILTKGTLILRDLDLIAQAATVTDVSTALSIGTLDEEVWRRSEPGTPHPRKRVEAVKKLNEAGVPCGVLVAPVLPGISDARDQIRTVVEACVEAGATFVSPILLHLRPVVRDVYMEWLKSEYPELVPRYVEMYPKAYAPNALQRELREEVSAAITDAGGLRRAQPRPKRNDRWQRNETREPKPEAQQLSLI